MYLTKYISYTFHYRSCIGYGNTIFSYLISKDYDL